MTIVTAVMSQSCVVRAFVGLVTDLLEGLVGRKLDTADAIEFHLVEIVDDFVIVSDLRNCL